MLLSSSHTKTICFLIERSPKCKIILVSSCLRLFVYVYSGPIFLFTVAHIGVRGCRLFWGSASSLSDGAVPLMNRIIMTTTIISVLKSSVSTVTARAERESSSALRYILCSKQQKHLAVTHAKVPTLIHPTWAQRNSSRFIRSLRRVYRCRFHPAQVLS